MKVEVLMSTYNGENCIDEQLKSIANQATPVHITIRDDGSKDRTIEIVKKYKEIALIPGENQGATESFLSLIELAPEADYYAFADQDDVWDNDKIDIAINTLKAYTDRPAIYSGNTRLVDGNLNFIKNEDLNPKTSLGSAIVKNYATGCTVVFNKALMVELKKYRPNNVPFHDWWVNLVCLSIGGTSLYDIEPHMSYRQHGNNVVGGNDSVWKKWTSRLMKFNKPYHRDEMAKQILDAYDVGTDEKKILKSIAEKKNDKSLKTGKRLDDFLFRICLMTGKI